MVSLNIYAHILNHQTWLSICQIRMYQEYEEDYYSPDAMCGWYCPIWGGVSCKEDTKVSDEGIRDIATVVVTTEDEK